MYTGILDPLQRTGILLVDNKMCNNLKQADKMQSSEKEI
jgi:hypothetical protein